MKTFILIRQLIITALFTRAVSGYKLGPGTLRGSFGPKVLWGLPRQATYLSDIGHIQQFPKHVDTRGLQHLMDECGQRGPLGRLGKEQELLLVLARHLHLGTHGCTEGWGSGLGLSGAARQEEGEAEGARALSGQGQGTALRPLLQ